MERRHTAASLRGIIRPMVILYCEYGMKNMEDSVARPVCQKCLKYRGTKRVVA